jgi:hypothetical protein
LSENFFFASPSEEKKSGAFIPFGRTWVVILVQTTQKKKVAWVDAVNLPRGAIHQKVCTLSGTALVIIPLQAFSKPETKKTKMMKIKE